MTKGVIDLIIDNYNALLCDIYDKEIRRASMRHDKLLGKGIYPFLFIILIAVYAAPVVGYDARDESSILKNPVIELSPVLQATTDPEFQVEQRNNRRNNTFQLDHSTRNDILHLPMDNKSK